MRFEFHGEKRRPSLVSRALEIPTVVLAIGAVIPSAYLGLLAVVAASGKRAPVRPVGRSGTPVRFLVCIPAHDEEDNIGQAVEALSAQSYDHRAFEIHVVADNCSDETASTAEQAGAHVHVRVDPTEPGKGAALNWLAGRLEPDANDAVVIIDADTIAEPEFLAALDRAFQGGAEVVQGHYGVKDPDSSSTVALRSAAILCRHHLRPLARNLLGGSSGLYGNGMGFRAELMRDRRWTNHLVEDAEYQMELLMDGILVRYVPDAVVRAEMPESLAAATSQNERWELGRMQLARRYVPRLVRTAVTGGRAPRRAYVDAALDHLTPPLALQALVDVTAASAGMVLVLVRPGRSSRFVVAAGLASCLMLAGHVVTGLRLAGAPPSVYRSLVTAPKAVLWKLLLLARIARRPDSVAWKRTERNGPGVER